MKRWLSAMLGLTMLISTVLGDVSWAIAEVTEDVVMSANVEADVPLSTDAGDSGLIVEVEDIEIVDPESEDTDISDEEPAVEIDAAQQEETSHEDDAAGENTEALSVEDVPAGEIEGEKPSEVRLSAVECPDFVFGYAVTLEEDVAVFENADAEEVAAILGGGEAVLCLSREGEYAKVVFVSEKGVIEGFIDARQIMPMNDEEINGFMDLAASYEAVFLYNDDINYPLPAPECAFPQAGEAAKDEAGDEAADVPVMTAPSEMGVEAVDAESNDNTVKLSCEEAILAVGESFTLKVLDSENNEIEAEFVTDDGNIATVTEDGIVNAHAAGECEITVRIGGALLACRIMVREKPAAISVTESLQLFEGQTQKIEVAFDPEDAASLLTFESDRPEVASVDEDGTVAAKSAGTANIIVKTRSGCMDECIVTVEAAPEQIVLSGTDKLSVGMNGMISAVIRDKDGDAMDVEFIFAYVPEDSEKPAIVIDEKTGAVQGKNPGRAVVTVTARNDSGVICGSAGEPLRAAWEIDVAAAPEKVKLAASKGSIGYKEYFGGLNPKAYDANGNEVPATFTYKSGNKKYVTVNEEGVIYGKKAGVSAYVYAYAHNGKYARCKVTVKKAPTKVKLDPTAVVLSAGGMVFDGLKASVGSGQACNTYTYSGYDKNIVSVDANGVITSRNAGSTEITVSAYNGVSATLPVTVMNPPEEVFFNTKAMTIGVGQTAAVSADNRNADGESAPSGYTYSVAEEDGDKLSVDPVTGEIKGLSEGKAKVLVSTHNGVTTWNDDGMIVTAVCEVNVLSAPEAIAFTQTKLTIGYKEKLSLKELVRFVMPDGETLITPEEAAKQGLYAASYTFKSGSKSNVSVNSLTGEITGKKAGKSAQITVTDHNGNYARVKVTVKKAPTKVTVSPSTLKLGANGMQYKLTAKANSGAYSNQYTYSTSDPTIITVDERTGVITTVGHGEATVTAESFNGRTGKCKVTVYPEPAEISLSEYNAVLGVGSSFVLSASAKDANGNATYADYTWSVVQGADVISVDEATGKITATGKGEAIVRIRAHNGITGCVSDTGAWIEAQCRVRVIAAPSALELSKTGITIGYKETFYGIPGFVTIVLPEGETECKTGFAYTSTRKTYVTVDSATGAVYGKKVGYSYINITPDADIDPVKVKVTVKKAPTKATLSDTAVTLSAGGQKWQLTAGVNSGAACSNYKWTTSDENVAVVDKNGLVTSVGTGIATITVTPYKGTKATCTVNVLDKPVQVFMPEAIIVAKGQKAQIRADVSGYDGTASTADYIYSTEDARISLNAETGEIVGLEVTGEDYALVSVRTHSGLSTHWNENGVAVPTVCRVKVIEAPAKVELNTYSATIGVSEKITLVPEMYTPEGEAMNGGTYTFTVEGTSVSVDENGTVKGKATGTSYVRAVSQDGMVSEPCKIVVKKAPTSVSLTPSKATLGVGQKNTLKVKLSSGAAGSYTFSSSNKNVAVVEPDGTVTAVGVGKATITVKTYNGKKDTTTLTVKEAPEFLDLNTDYTEIYDEVTGGYKLVYFKQIQPGETFKLTYKAEAYTVGKAVDFISSDENIVIAQPDGTLTGVNEGCALVLVESSGGVLEMCFVIVESTASPFDFLDEDGEITLALNEMIPMPAVTNGSELYDMFIEYDVDGSCVEIVQEDDGSMWLKAVKSGTGTLYAWSYHMKEAELKVSVAKAPSNVKVIVPEILTVGEETPVEVTFDSLGSYTLSVSDEEIAEITEDGILRAFGVGEVTVTAVMQTGVSASAGVLLRNKPEKVELAEDAAELVIGDTFRIEPILDVNAWTEYTFVSSDSEVAEVSESGLVTAKIPGSARIIVRTSVPGVFAYCDITIKEPEEVPAFEIEPNALDLRNSGEGGMFTVSLPEGDRIDSVVSDNESLCESITVDVEGGTITVGSPLMAGRAVLTVTTVNGLSAQCIISVSEAPSAIYADISEITLAEGETHGVNISFAPEFAVGNVTAESTDADVASADENGLITANLPGEAVISFYTEGVDLPVQVAVKVIHAPETMRLSTEYIDLAQGAVIKLDPPEMISTKGAAGGSYVWAVEDETIAAVDENGWLTAVNTGVTTVMARAYNGVSAAITVTVWPEATEISFAEEQIIMAVNETYSPVVLTEAGAVVGAVFTSDDTGIVTIDEYGRLAAVAEGDTIVAASCGELTARITVQVRIPAKNVVLNAEHIALGVKERFALNVELDAGAASAGLEMVSDNPAVASVSKDGVITAHHPGNAVITVTAFGGAQASCEVSVSAAPTGVAFEESDINVNVLEKGMQLRWYFDESAQGGSVRFETEDESVAEVDENGYVTFKKVGWTTIGIVTYNGCTDIANITVHRVPEKIEFEYPEIVIQKGDTVNNSVTMTRNSFANYEITSENGDVVTVDDEGRFTAVNTGTTTVTLKAACGLEAGCSVTVVEKLDGMKISDKTLSLALGETAQLGVSFEDKNAVANVRYVSSNTSIAAVDEFTGEVTAKKKGSCTIYVQTPDGTNSDSCAVTVNGPRYRMFLAYEYFGTEYKGNLYFPQNNVNSMKAAFEKSKINGVQYDFRTMKNPSKNSLLSGITGYFADSNESDVNVIYLCSHGHANINDTSVNGYTQYGISLQGYKTTYDLGSPYYYVTATEIYACISQIKGKVVLILDSCNSGQFILNMTPKLKSRQDRLAVLTAVQGGVNASYYDVSSTTKAVDFFTYFLLYGIGYDEKKDKHDHVLRADTNDNEQITLKEFFEYGKTATSGYVSKSSTYKAKWFHGNKSQVPQSYIKGDMEKLVIYQPK